MNRTSLQLLRPMILVFILLNVFFITARQWLSNKGVDQEVMIIGNLLLFVVSVIIFLITHRSLQSSNPNTFIRAMYGGFIIKFFAVAIAAFIYIMIAKKNVNKPALFACMLLYVVYTFIEVKTLLGVLKQKKNA
jgi:hypothetical protein